MLGRGLLLFIGCFCKVYMVLPPFRVVRKGFFYLCGRRSLEPAAFYVVWRQVITLKSTMSIMASISSSLSPSGWKICMFTKELSK